MKGGQMMKKKELSRREFLQIAATTGGAMLAGSSLLSVPSEAIAAPGKPIPPISIMYYGNWQEIVEFFKKAAIDLRKLGITPKLNPAVNTTVVAKSLKEHDYGDVSSIAWGAIPYRLDPNFLLEELMHSARAKVGGRNYGHYKSAKFDAACDAQKKEMDRNTRQKLDWEAQAVAAADYPIWWLAHPVVISAYNERDFEGAVEMMGCGYGLLYSMWSYLKMRPKTERKTLRSGLQVEFDSLNPFTASTSPNQTFMRYFYDTFARIGPDLKPQPWAAESWKVVEPTIIDLVLRNGMKFHDGRPVTDEDVRFTFDYLKKWNFPFFKHAMDAIERVEVRDRNIRFHLVKPYAPFFFITLTWLFILPKHIWEKVPQEVGVKHPGEYENPNPIGSGPFMFGHWRKGQEIYFKANKEHFAAPALDDFYFVIIPSVDGVAGAIERGEIDITQYTLTPSLAERLKEVPFLRVGYTPSHMVYEARPDMRKKPFDDANFRKAIYHALDRRPFINFFAGQAIEASNTPISPLNKFWHNPNLPAPEYHIEKAKEVLRKAGYTWDSEGRLCFPG